MLQCQNDDLNQLEVTLRANPGHLRIIFEKKIALVWSVLRGRRFLTETDGWRLLLT